MFKTFKKFDVHVKTVDGVNQQTIIGAIITLISTILVVVLILSEISYFMKIDVVSRMLTDSTANVESVKLEFDLQFYDVSCNRIEFMQEVTRGTLHLHEPGVVEKFVIDDGKTLGCHIRGSNVIDKVGGNFRFAIEPTATPAPSSTNISHHVRRVSFVPTKGESAVEKMPELRDSLDNQVSIVEDASIYHYAVQVVPTQYKTLYGELYFANQYSVIEKAVTAQQLTTGAEPVAGLHLRDFRGIVFTYDFHPVMLYMEERREKIVDFVSNLFGIVGGLITVLTLFEGVVHQSAKKFIGKSD
ncbi:endoplasmic reticulum vesicle transporter-domain-containing protein [Ochromonadaceae sp. CCMP2298]|nr:endoplasmic reticulum vesicle transporter-domain-containing protein [Ochromonadaceae sp. CCMP2298]|mmetsp:Transcript_29295/g.65006  ORF Transcript_29295/g.65006 Transcript_29295/m.65006 type:complete len:300 (+) Transcript_29295:151-1050(+)